MGVEKRRSSSIDASTEQRVSQTWSRRSKFFHAKKVMKEWHKVAAREVYIREAVISHLRKKKRELKWSTFHLFSRYAMSEKVLRLQDEEHERYIESEKLVDKEKLRNASWLWQRTLTAKALHYWCEGTKMAVEARKEEREKIKTREERLKQRVKELEEERERSKQDGDKSNDKMIEAVTHLAEKMGLAIAFWRRKMMGWAFRCVNKYRKKRIRQRNKKLEQEKEERKAKLMEVDPMEVYKQNAQRKLELEFKEKYRQARKFCRRLTLRRGLRAFRSHVASRHEGGGEGGEGEEGEGVE